MTCRKLRCGIWFFFIFSINFNIQVWSQNIQMSGYDLVKDYISNQKESWNLTEEDIADLEISYSYTSIHNNVKHYYIQQTIDGTPIYNALTSVYLTPQGKAGSVRPGFVPNARNLVLGNPLKLSPVAAIMEAASHLNISAHPAQLRSLESNRSGENTFEADFADENIHVNPMYVFDKDGKLRLCWDLAIIETGSSDFWSVKVDGESGEIIQVNNWTVYCDQANMKYGSRHDCGSHDDDAIHKLSFQSLLNTSETNQYKVYPLPIESPSTGNHTIVSNPHILQASPFGWHDTDGVEGAEFTITRGNNTHAFQNRNRTNTSSNDEPDGGEDLVFLFDHHIMQDSDSSEHAAITNLFYTNNMVHDLSYLLGFTEEAGNFQDNNYGKGGRDGDYVLSLGFDGNSRNNASFTTAPDGTRGRMQMFLWDKIRSLLTIDKPEALADRLYEFGPANFGPRLELVNATGPIVIAGDNTENPSTACSNIVTNLNGKVAMVDRGLCDFSKKVFNAQQRGAVLVMVCNVAGVGGGTGDELISMGAGENAGQVSIPSLFMKKSDCDLIKIALGNGEEVIATVKDRPIDGPRDIDGNFDNGVILHEYAHGISIRLTGGPMNTGCLINFDTNGDGRRDAGEQMGEGWSDFFGLIFTTKPGDEGNTPRGIGTYVTGSNPSDRGIRVFPYSTDMSVNPLTYDYIKTSSVPHGVGAVWAAMLWDLFWEFTDLYGFDPDWTNTTSGNFISTLLVMDGMKLQPCNPGFVDGRDAILEADKINFEGKHQKLIWEVFARRGLGAYADQGHSNDHRDGSENFEIPPLLIEELKIQKSINRNIRPGDILDVQIVITNHIPENQSDLIIREELPEGLTLINGSNNVPAEVFGNEIQFHLNKLLYEASDTIRFQLKSSPDIHSILLYYDDVESSQSEWKTESTIGDVKWLISNKDALSGTRSWYMEEKSGVNLDQRLVSPALNVLGQNPVFRFWHKYDVLSSENGGIVEIKQENSNIWEKVDDKMIIRNHYPGQLSFFTFAIPFLEGFSGTTSDKWIDTYIDLSQYRGSNIQIRFRFGTEGSVRSGAHNPGWFIDELEMMDIKTYETIACVSSQENPEERCTPKSFTVVNSNTVTQVDIPESQSGIYRIFPNPANDLLYVESTQGHVGQSRVLIHSLAGKTVYQQVFPPVDKMAIQTSEFPAGIYFIQIIEGSRTFTEKFIIAH